MKTKNRVKKMLSDQHFKQNASIWADWEIIEIKKEAIITLFLLDRNRNRINSFTIQTNENGYVHLTQVVSMIIDAFQIGIEMMMYSFDCSPLDGKSIC